MIFSRPIKFPTLRYPFPCSSQNETLGGKIMILSLPRIASKQNEFNLKRLKKRNWGK
jgi:hypothetical protein